MHRVTRILMAAEERLDQIIDSVYCPISGVVMTDPVLMSDSVTYERANIEAWISTHGNLSPISQQPFTGTPTISSVVQNRIKSSSATLSPQPVLRIRLRVSMQWLVQSKCPLETFESAYRDFSMRRFTTEIHGHCPLIQTRASTSPGHTAPVFAPWCTKNSPMQEEKAPTLVSGPKTWPPGGLSTA